MSTLMEELFEKDFVWKIKNLSPLQPKQCYSDPFLIGGCIWLIFATPKGNDLEFSYLYLGIAYPKLFHARWKSDVSLRFTIVNKLSRKLSIVKGSSLNFDEKSLPRRYPILLHLTSKLLAEDGGFLVKGKLKVVLEVINHDYEAIENHGSMTNDTLNKTQQLKDSVDVNGFQVFPPQIGSVKRILERYPDIASEVRSKKQCLRTAYMNVILGLIETLCQLPQELSNDDLEQATAALSFAAKGGFKVDWLEKKLEEVKKKKKKVDTGKARLEQIEKEMCRLKNLMDKENTEVSAANVPFSFDDVV